MKIFGFGCIPCNKNQEPLEKTKQHSLEKPKDTLVERTSSDSQSSYLTQFFCWIFRSSQQSRSSFDKLSLTPPSITDPMTVSLELGWKSIETLFDQILERAQYEKYLEYDENFTAFHLDRFLYKKIQEDSTFSHLDTLITGNTIVHPLFVALLFKYCEKTFRLENIKCYMEIQQFKISASKTQCGAELILKKYTKKTPVNVTSFDIDAIKAKILENNLSDAFSEFENHILHLYTNDIYRLLSTMIHEKK